MESATQLAETFANLRDEINSNEPTQELCRDWAAELADACETLALIVERLDKPVNDPIWGKRTAGKRARVPVRKVPRA